LPERSGIS